MIATAAPIKVETSLCSAVEPEIPGPITINAVTGTFTDATSPRRSPRATIEQRNTVVPIATTPKLK